MDIASWSAVAGLVLLVMALSDSVLARLPLSTSIVYLAAGAAFSPLVFGWTAIDPVTHRERLERLTEVVVLLSLFGSGLKMSAGLGDGRWLLPLRLAIVSMVVTVALVAGAGWLVLGLPIGAAVLLGGMLAPTDPVLASDVQVAEPGDRDRLRFALTGEAGLNDGSAFPFVMLGLGLLGLHELGTFGWRWLAVDVVWAIAGGVAIGAVLGAGVGRGVLYLRRTHKEAFGLDNFLALGLIGVSYGCAVLVHAYGFLAVFVAGVALRQVEQRASVGRRGAAGEPSSKTKEEEASAGAGTSSRATPDAADPDAPASDGAANAQNVVARAAADPAASHAEQLATHEQHAPAYLAHAVLSFNEQVERIAEVVAVVALGALLWAVDWDRVSWGFVAALLFVIRPASVAIGLLGSKTSRTQRVLTGWFGIRGIGSLYYLFYASNHGLSPDLAANLTALVVASVVASIVLHGVSVTPIMARYGKAPARAR